MLWGETCVFARTFCLRGFSGKHTLTPGGNPVRLYLLGQLVPSRIPVSVVTVPDTLPGKQPFWDRPGIQVDRQMVENSLSSSIERAAFLAATSRHSGD